MKLQETDTLWLFRTKGKDNTALQDEVSVLTKSMRTFAYEIST